MQTRTVTKKNRSVQLIRWGRTSLSRRLGQMPLKEVQEEPLGMCQAGEAAQAREPGTGLAPRPAPRSPRAQGRSSSPQGLRCFGDGGIISLPVPVWAPHLLLNRKVCGTACRPPQGLSVIIPLLVLPASGHPPRPCCPTELRPPGRSQPARPLHRPPTPQQASAANVPTENLPV